MGLIEENWLEYVKPVRLDTEENADLTRVVKMAFYAGSSSVLASQSAFILASSSHEEVEREMQGLYHEINEFVTDIERQSAEMN